jgi:hypothetical protein
MAEKLQPEIDIHWVGAIRDFQMQRKTGLYTASLKVQVDYPLGSFELIFQVDRLPGTEAEIQESLREKILHFADLLKESALAQINVRKHPDPGS